MNTPSDMGWMGFNPMDPDPNAAKNAARNRQAVLANRRGSLTPDEQNEYDRLQSYQQGVPVSKGSGVGDIFDGQKKLLDTANSFTERQMGLSNKYRGIEGAWQGQIDEQANRRIKTDGDVKISLQNNQGSVDEKAKQNDARRALVNFRSDGKGAG